MHNEKHCLWWTWRLFRRIRWSWNHVCILELYKGAMAMPWLLFAKRELPQALLSHMGAVLDFMATYDRILRCSRGNNEFKHYRILRCSRGNNEFKHYSCLLNPQQTEPARPIRNVVQIFEKICYLVSMQYSLTPSPSFCLVRIFPIFVTFKSHR